MLARLIMRCFIEKTMSPQTGAGLLPEGVCFVQDEVFDEFQRVSVCLANAVVFFSMGSLFPYFKTTNIINVDLSKTKLQMTAYT